MKHYKVLVDGAAKFFRAPSTASTSRWFKAGEVFTVVVEDEVKYPTHNPGQPATFSRVISGDMVGYVKNFRKKLDLNNFRELSDAEV